ncbi:MAG: type I-B CRISPR-associated endonuclease Cas1b [Thermoplasmataceae archaeon]
MYTYYIASEGKIERDGNTLAFIGIDSKRHIPGKNISDIVISAKVSLSSWAIDYLAKSSIIVHILGEDGRYLSSIFPHMSNQVGLNVILQASSYLNMKKRVEIASEIVQGIRYNILRNLRYYSDKIDLDSEIETISSTKIIGETVEELLGFEGSIWKTYYSAFPKFLRNVKEFKRTFHPPGDNINAMISYGNALLYSSSLSAIYQSGLNPSISFVHEPSDRSFSLALDLADIFKPVIVERIVANLVNNQIMKETDFQTRDGGVYLTDGGRRKFTEYYRDKIQTTTKSNTSNRTITYQGHLLQECHNLLSHLKGEKRYKSFRSQD